ncbi:hypothetical protein TWF225_010715 [Orbilia oligospora]|nr:hypothetical protein TWF225_010715 [Orbilia oligospora]KAF3281872.1 hypothetical protein TWF132_011094 [Orbilia oligospora]
MQISAKRLRMFLVFVLTFSFLLFQVTYATTIKDGDGAIIYRWKGSIFTWCLKDNQCVGGADNTTLTFQACTPGEFFFNPSARWGFVGNMNCTSGSNRVESFWEGSIVNRYTDRCLTYKFGEGAPPIVLHDDLLSSLIPASTNMEALDCHQKPIGYLTTTPCIPMGKSNMSQMFRIFSSGPRFKITIAASDPNVCNKGKVFVHTLHGRVWLGCAWNGNETNLEAWDLEILTKLF